jgi:hypothetical protein
MKYWLKQSTAVTIKLGPFVDSTDGVTAETALTISQADIRLSKNGGDIAQSNNAAGATHDELGYYDIPLDTTDTNTLGTLKVMVSESGALPVWADFMVVPANVWDSLFGADRLQVDTRELGDANLALTTQMKADVNAEADSALTDYDAPTNAEMTARTLAAEDYFAPASDTVTVGTNNDKDGYTLSAAGVDAILDEVVEGTTTMRQFLRLFASALLGKLSGGGTSTLAFRDVGDTKARITATVDENGNRTAVVTDAT